MYVCVLASRERERREAGERMIFRMLNVTINQPLQDLWRVFEFYLFIYFVVVVVKNQPLQDLAIPEMNSDSRKVRNIARNLSKLPPIFR